MRVLVVASLVLAAIPLAASVGVNLPCSFVPSAGPVDASCVPPIHPGARSSACTLNWVVTDGIDLFVGAAQHCVGAIGQPLFVEGASGSVGTLAWKGRNDSAFYRIDAEDRALVSGSLEGWGGPNRGPTGVATRAPFPGETLLYYGHGYFTDAYEPLRARAGTAVYAWPTDHEFIFTGQVSGGDSGSPVMLATGEAVGLISAAVFPLNLVPVEHPDVPGPTVVFGVLLDTELKHFGKDLGRPLTLVTGEPTVEL